MPKNAYTQTQMMARASRKSVLLLATKALVWSLVVSVLMSSLPIPVAVVSENSAEADAPFPCRGNSCGCKSAFQCWTNCCCNSPQQRLDWAARNGVKVPTYGQHLKQLVVEQKSRPSAKPACCQKAKSTIAIAKPACCEVKPPEQKTILQPRTKVVLSMLALGCRGSVGELASLPWAIVVVPQASPWDLGILEFKLDIVDVQGPSRFYPPELPPPRLS